jgi:uncharacterized protein YajQ (UPF0234 family)
MPSFDISSSADKVNLANAVDVVRRQIQNRYDFKGTSASIEFNEKDLIITLFGDNDFQINQIKDILLPSLEKKEPDSTKRLMDKNLESISGNNVKLDIEVSDGIDQELGKKIIKLLKDSKLKVQASIQGDTVRVTGAKRDILQESIALVKANVSDYPLNFGNFRD